MIILKTIYSRVGGELCSHGVLDASSGETRAREEVNVFSRVESNFLEVRGQLVLAVVIPEPMKC